MPAEGHRHSPRGSFLERSIATLLDTLEQASESDQMARADGFLQKLDPRTKLVSMLALVVAAALARNLFSIAVLFAIAAFAALISRIRFAYLGRRIWFPILPFTAVIAGPALFITPGPVLARVPLLGLPVTQTGLSAALYLLARVETTATLLALLVFTTPWSHVLKAMRVLGVPVILVVTFSTTIRYIFLLLRTALEMFESRKSRLVGVLPGPERRRLAAAGAGVLLTKTLQLGDEVFSAMQARGFRGEVYVLDDFAMKSRDWSVLAAALALTAGAVALGRWRGTT